MQTDPTPQSTLRSTNRRFDDRDSDVLIFPLPDSHLLINTVDTIRQTAAREPTAHPPRPFMVNLSDSEGF